MSQYVTHNFVRPATWPSAELEAGWPAHVESVLRGVAVGSGQQVVGAPERLGEPERIQVETDEGWVDAIAETYRAEVTEGAAAVTEATVDSVETAPGVWAADVPPGVLILGVRHGLGSLDVDVNLVDADGFPTGYVAPIPISGSEVEVVLGAGSKARRAFVTLVPDDDTDEDEPALPAAP